MILKPFAATTIEILPPDSNFLPLNNRDASRLLAHIPEGEETYLTLQDNLNTEWVRAENQCGQIVIHRGIDTSEPLRFPRGTCVFFETSVPVIKWLICHLDCCTEFP